MILASRLFGQFSPRLLVASALLGGDVSGVWSPGVLVAGSLGRATVGVEFVSGTPAVPAIGVPWVEGDWSSLDACVSNGAARCRSEPPHAALAKKSSALTRGNWVLCNWRSPPRPAERSRALGGDPVHGACPRAAARVMTARG